MFVQLVVMKSCSIYTVVCVYDTGVSFRIFVIWVLVDQVGDEARYVDSDVFCLV